MDEHGDGAPVRVCRRHFLAGTGAAAVAGSMGVLGGATPASAGASLKRANPAPLPIPGGQPSGLPAGHPLEFIHWFLPGPVGTSTPIIGLPGEGLDVEPGMITDYEGFTAFAVVSGKAEGSDGQTYDVEFDVRVMDGRYVAEDGSRNRGTFAFF